MKTEVIKDGEQLCLVLPSEALTELGWGPGDVIDLEVEAGGLRVTRSMTKHELAMASARRAFKRYREAFEMLAKS